MDSTLVQAIQENTASNMALAGSLWAVAGFIGIMTAGCIALYYTIRGH